MVTANTLIQGVLQVPLNVNDHKTKKDSKEIIKLHLIDKLSIVHRKTVHPHPRGILYWSGRTCTEKAGVQNFKNLIGVKKCNKQRGPYLSKEQQKSLDKEKVKEI